MPHCADAKHETSSNSHVVGKRLLYRPLTLLSRTFRRYEMDTPSKDARLAIWKVTLARSSFIQTRRACEALLQLGASAPEVVSTTALVFYARPFKQDSDVRLDKALVPVEFTDLHEDIIRYRDKVIAHRDVKGPETPWGTANDVVFCWAGSSMEIETTSPVLDFGAAQRLSILAAALFEVMDRQLLSLIQQNLPPPLKDGRYILGLRGDKVGWLIRQP